MMFAVTANGRTLQGKELDPIHFALVLVHGENFLNSLCSPLLLFPNIGFGDGKPQRPTSQLARVLHGVCAEAESGPSTGLPQAFL